MCTVHRHRHTVKIVIRWFEEMTLWVPLFVPFPSYQILPRKHQEIFSFFFFFEFREGVKKKDFWCFRMFRSQEIGKHRRLKRKRQQQVASGSPKQPNQETVFLPSQAPTTISAAKISGMKLNLASCRITTVISCCLDKIATKLCHNASKWSLK